MTEDEVLAFIRRWFPSVWTLELLLLMQNDRERVWASDQLIRELRASVAIVSDSLRVLEAAGLVTHAGPESYRFQPRTTELAELTMELQRIHSEKPTLLVREIMSAPNDKIQTFADAFRFKR